MLRTLALALALVLTSCGDDASVSADASVDAAVDGNTASPGCATPTTLTPGSSTARTMFFAGRDRTYRVRLPQSYDATPRPIVFVLHGGFGTADQIENNSADFDPIGDRENFILVYPNGIASNEAATNPLARAQTWNGGACCGAAANQNVDDVGFLMAVLDQVEADTCADTGRVFFTGMSNGAIMSHRMACERADRVTAIAPVAGSLQIPTCTPSRPVPLFAVHGTLDENVPYLGGAGCGPGMVTTEPIPDIVAGWATRNHCSGSPSTIFTEGDGTCVSSGTCDAETVLCSIDMGDHSWPGESRNADRSCGSMDGRVSTTFHASEAIWAFFARQ